MNSKHDYLLTSLWYKQGITDPYQTIAEFFSSAALSSHRKCIKDVLKAAAGNFIWRKLNPGDLLYEFKMIESINQCAEL